jgi:hypothetical protein
MVERNMTMQVENKSCKQSAAKTEGERVVNCYAQICRIRITEDVWPRAAAAENATDDAAERAARIKTTHATIQPSAVGPRDATIMTGSEFVLECTFDVDPGQFEGDLLKVSLA